MITLIETYANEWLNRHTSGFLRRALGVIFLWFGLLKFCPGLCDVELLAQRTLTLLTLHLVTPQTCTRLLGVWECAMGLTLLLARPGTRLGRTVLRLCSISLLLHLCGTFLPLVLFPVDTWRHAPFAPTLAGQYILKNIVLLAAAFAVAKEAVRAPMPAIAAVPARTRFGGMVGALKTR